MTKKGDTQWSERAVRADNATPWQPLPGFYKRRCVDCDYWYAAPVTQRGEALCPDCVILHAHGKSYHERYRRKLAAAKTVAPGQSEPV